MNFADVEKAHKDIEVKFNDLNEKNEDLPKYFLRNFHYQTDGYLSENSANLYEFQVETLFSGSAATMRRFSLLPIIEYLKSKDEDLNFLDVGTGSGEFIKTIKYNFPKLKITCSDISGTSNLNNSPTISGHFLLKASCGPLFSLSSS